LWLITTSPPVWTAQEIAQPAQRVGVEVVGWLVEQQRGR
jgi:hypothetical protein